jgi:hypothetical protein
VLQWPSVRRSWVSEQGNEATEIRILLAKGVMRDLLKDYPRPYFWPYLIFGGSIVLSGVILFAIPMIRRAQERRKPLTQHQLDMGVRSYAKKIVSAP